MKFSSKEEICIYFNIDASKTKEEIIKELKQMQASIHPDQSGKQTEEEIIKFSQIAEAKRFLRGYDTTVMVPLEDVSDILTLVKNEDMHMISDKEKIEEKIKHTTHQLIKTVKNNWKPAKITSTSIAALASVIWAFPSLIIEHPILSSLRISRDFYDFLTLLWALAITVCCIVWFFAYIKEREVKELLDILMNEDCQYEILSKLLKDCRNSKNKKKSFTSNTMVQYIERWMYCNNIGFDSFFKRFLRLLSRKNYYSSVHSVIEEVSEIIIDRALEKGLIIKESKYDWYDSYIVNELKQF